MGARACGMGLEGIVSKRKDSAYRSGRSPDWLKMKNPKAPTVRREAEGLGQGEVAVTATGKNRIMIYGLRAAVRPETTNGRSAVI
jgi:hypothetical protein